MDALYVHQKRTAVTSSLYVVSGCISVIVVPGCHTVSRALAWMPHCQKNSRAAWWMYR
jgi:hypothetical protein